MASSGGKEIRLRIVGPGGRTRESVFDQESVILGSGAGAAVRIPDPRLSELHLMLKKEPDGTIKVIDLGSEQGTYVAGQRVVEPRPLGPGETVSVGPWRVEVVDGPEEDARKSALQVSLLWGDQVLGVRHFARGTPVRIGGRRGNDFHVFSRQVGGSLRLAVAGEGGVTITPPPGARVTVSSGGRALRPGDAAALTLRPDEEARVEVEDVALVLRQVVPPARLSSRRKTDGDYTFLRIAGLCLMAGVAAMMALVFIPVGSHRTSEELFQESAQRVHYLIRPAPPIPSKHKPTPTVEGAKAAEEEGKFGKPEAEKKEAEPSLPGSPIADPTKRERDRATIRRVGLLGAVAKLGGKDGASGLLGPGGFGTGINESLGGLKAGGGRGDAHGFGGLGARGTGPGAGGTGLGLGGLGTRGKGRGPAGTRDVDLGGLQKEVVKVVPGKTVIVGGLPRDVIFKVVKSHEREIQYCYESALNAQPDLAGKVAVAWTINPDGSVAEATVTETTLLSERAEQCMLTRIRRWKFPEVPGGGIVSVTFPWVFKPAGSDSGEG